MGGIIILPLTKSYGQKIEIGQDANRIKRIVELTTRDRIGFDSYGKSKGNNAGWDVKYYNGEISEVIQCFYKQYLADIRLLANYCKHYIMNNGKLDYVLTQYEDVSVSKLKEFYGQSPRNRKIEEFYFSDDYTHYSKIFLHSNGLATVEQRKTNPNTLPTSVRSEINKKLKRAQEIKRQRYAAKQKEKQDKIAIKSKIYDLKQYSPEKYKESAESLRNSLKKYFVSTSSYHNDPEDFPSFATLAKSKEKYARFTNVYVAHYENEDHSRETVNYGNVVVVGSNDIRLKKDIKLLKGDDHDLKLFKRASIYLPTIEVEGYEVTAVQLK